MLIFETNPEMYAKWSYFIMWLSSHMLKQPSHLLCHFNKYVQSHRIPPTAKKKNLESYFSLAKSILITSQTVPWFGNLPSPNCTDKKKKKKPKLLELVSTLFGLFYYCCNLSPLTTIITQLLDPPTEIAIGSWEVVGAWARSNGFTEMIAVAHRPKEAFRSISMTT